MTVYSKSKNLIGLFWLLVLLRHLNHTLCKLVPTIKDVVFELYRGLLLCVVSMWSREITPNSFSSQRAGGFNDADNFFKGSLIGIMVHNIVEVYMDLPTDNRIWDTLETMFGVVDGGNELYIMERIFFL